jgi:hypothetical protein
MNGVDRRRVKFDAELGENRDELWAEGFEGLLGLPDVEDLDFSVRFERAVIKPSSRRAETGRVKSSDRLVVFLGGEAAVPEVSADRHVRPLVVSGWLEADCQLAVVTALGRAGSGATCPACSR